MTAEKFAYMWFIGTLVCVVVGAIRSGWTGTDEPFYMSIWVGVLWPFSPVFGTLWLLFKIGELARNAWDRPDDLG